MAVGHSAAPTTPERRTGATAGYIAVVIVNAILLIAVNSDALWDWLTFVTPDIDEVLPIIQLSLIATIVANIAYVAYDAPWFRSATQVVVLGINLRATVRLLRVFPFDFTGYTIPLDAIVRVVLILALVGMAIALIVEVVRLVGAAARAVTGA